jgi:hypothetical protein
MSDKKIGTRFHVMKSSSEGCDLTVMAWSAGAHGGLTTHLALTEAQARELVEELNATLAKLPRIGTPADLGCEVL